MAATVQWPDQLGGHLGSDPALLVSLPPIPLLFEDLLDCKEEPVLQSQIPEHIIATKDPYPGAMIPLSLKMKT